MKEIVLIDGGVGQEIFRKAGKPAHPLWSTKVMMEEPAIVKEVHQEFINAGARIITTNSYTCTPTRLERDGERDWFEELQIKSFDIADEARKSLGYSSQDVQIAACIPPLIGSYTSDPRSFAELKAEYQQIVDIQAPRADLFIIETISVIREAQAAVEAALEGKKPILLSFTLSDYEPHKLRSGESIAEAIDAIKGYKLEGLLFNCSFPETITKGLEDLKNTGIPYGGYANGFTTVEPLKPGGTVGELTARKDLNASIYAQQVLEWVEHGASIVGGCCEVGPAHIAELRDQLIIKDYRITPLQKPKVLNNLK
mgnify:CR=1 FL=1